MEDEGKEPVEEELEGKKVEQKKGEHKVEKVVEEDRKEKEEEEEVMGEAADFHFNNGEGSSSTS